MKFLGRMSCNNWNLSAKDYWMSAHVLNQALKAAKCCLMKVVYDSRLLYEASVLGLVC